MTCFSTLQTLIRVLLIVLLAGHAQAVPGRNNTELQTYSVADRFRRAGETAFREGRYLGAYALYVHGVREIAECSESSAVGQDTGLYLISLSILTNQGDYEKAARLAGKLLQERLHAFAKIPRQRIATCERSLKNYRSVRFEANTSRPKE